MGDFLVTQENILILIMSYRNFFSSKICIPKSIFFLNKICSGVKTLFVQARRFRALYLAGRELALSQFVATRIDGVSSDILGLVSQPHIGVDINCVHCPGAAYDFL